MPPDRRFPFQGPRPIGRNNVQANPQREIQSPPRQTEQTHRKQTQIPRKKAPSPAPAKHAAASNGNPLQGLMQNMDSDTLLILAVLLLLSKEQTDRRLLLALAYIIL